MVHVHLRVQYPAAWNLYLYYEKPHIWRDGLNIETEPRLVSQGLNMGMLSVYILDVKSHTRLTDIQVTGQRVGRSREAVINEFIEFR